MSVDLVAATEVARRELYRFLAAHDLVERVSYPFAAANDPLGWALEDACPDRLQRTRARGSGSACWTCPRRLPPANTGAPGTSPCVSRTRWTWPPGTYGFEVRRRAGRGRPACDDDAPATVLLRRRRRSGRCCSAAGVAAVHAAGLRGPKARGSLSGSAGCWTCPGCPTPSTDSETKACIDHE